MALFGRSKKYYQFYAQVHFLTCETCLSHHGEISEAPHPQPPLHPDCRCHLLEFPATELEYYQEQSERMKLRAQNELLRRKLWRQAVENLNGSDFSKAEELFRQAAQVEFYLEEVEQLCAEKKELLAQNPHLRARLQKLFVKFYRMKFSLDKYRPIPPRLILLWETQGLERIKELLG
ncbi:MAG: hypothetical protein NZ610_07190 [Candidatus Bipolaricaulota bacterium]|nr:hypothetical protein [Candidatus Bipolaricaulota bacterium]MCS7275164.1 hypothetical protein [Candidatus Bipolaricaulota bacterium]MDW8110467.1 hypothetical protein [Candidatus Bipolaricaulota bacterium]MDW8329148.1 hypothetical protein [Candidatus Bipolaricaulota bacterium]